MVSESLVRSVLDKYAQAWVHGDSELITSLFTEDGIYAERAFEAPYTVHKEIKQYWIDKVLGEQRNITFTLLSVIVSADLAVAEWEAEFDDIKRGLHVTMREIAVLEFNGDKIKSLREYWQSRKTPLNEDI